MPCRADKYKSFTESIPPSFNFSFDKKKMSDIAGKKLLDDSVQKVVAFFNNEVSPRLNKKNKVISVSVAVALTLVYIIRDRVFKPPRNIRHIPYFGYFSVIKSLYKGDSLFDRGYKVIIPMLNKSNLGLYAVGF